MGWVFITLNADAPDVADQLSTVEEMICPPGLPAFNYHTIHQG